MAYAIKYEYREGKRVRVSWISKYGSYATSDLQDAARFGKRESAESRALMLCIENSAYIGKLKIALIVVPFRKGAVRWREKKEE